MQYILGEEEFKTLQENKRIAGMPRMVIQAAKKSKPTCVGYPSGYPGVSSNYCGEHCHFVVTLSVADARHRCLLDRPASYEEGGK